MSPALVRDKAQAGSTEIGGSVMAVSALDILC